MMQAATQDPGLQEQMARLAQNIGQMLPEDMQGDQGYQFGGEESISLDQAMRLMDRLNDYDDLERSLKDVRDWEDFSRIDEGKVRDLLGDEAQEQMEQLAKLAQT